MVNIGTTAYFEAAHRQYGDESKCGRLHGHNWKVDFVLQGDNINPVGYLINFRELKDIVAGLDHAVILHCNDPLVKILQNADQKVVVITKNPSCENLAIIICESVPKIGLDSVSVTIWENDDSYAQHNWIAGSDL